MAVIRAFGVHSSDTLVRRLLGGTAIATLALTLAGPAAAGGGTGGNSSAGGADNATGAGGNGGAGGVHCTAGATLPIGAATGTTGGNGDNFNRTGGGGYGAVVIPFGGPGRQWRFRGIGLLLRLSPRGLSASR